MHKTMTELRPQYPNDYSFETLLCFVFRPEDLGEKASEIRETISRARDEAIQLIVEQIERMKSEDFSEDIIAAFFEQEQAYMKRKVFAMPAFLKAVATPQLRSATGQLLDTEAKRKYLSRKGLSLEQIANLKHPGTSWEGAYLKNVLISGLNIQAINLKQSDFSWSELEKTTFEEVDISSSNFAHTQITESQWRQSIAEHANFQQGGFNKTLFQKINANGISFKGAAFFQSEIAQSNLQNALFQSGQLDQMILKNNDFNHANFKAATIGSTVPKAYSVFEACNLKSCVFSNSTLRQVQFIKCDLSKADFRQATFRQVSFVDCNLQSADLRGSTISDSFKAKSDFRGAHLVGATVHLVQLEALEKCGADVSNMDIVR